MQNNIRDLEVTCEELQAEVKEKEDFIAHLKADVDRIEHKH